MEDLQALWDRASAKEVQSIEQSAVDQVISKKSTHELTWFYKTIYYECLAGWGMLAFLGAGLFLLPKNRLELGLLIVYFTMVVVFYHFTLKRYHQVQPSDNLQHYLEKSISFLKAYVFQYLAICWFGGVLGLAIGYFSKDWVSYSGAGITWLENNTIPGLDYALAIGIVVLMLLFAHYYIKYIYRRRINNLQMLLDELKES